MEQTEVSTSSVESINSTNGSAISRLSQATNNLPSEKKYLVFNLVLQQLLAPLKCVNKEIPFQTINTDKDSPLLNSLKLLGNPKPIEMSLPNQCDISFCATHDGKKLFCGTYKNSVSIFDIADPTKPNYITTFPFNKEYSWGNITDLVIRSDNKILFAAQQTKVNSIAMNLIAICDISNPTQITTLATIDKLQAGHTCLKLTHDNHTLIAGCENGAIKFWNVSNPQKPLLISTINESTLGDIDMVTCLSLNSNNRILFSGSMDQTVKIWDIADLKNPRLITTLGVPSQKKEYKQIRSIVVSSENKTLFTAWNNAIKIWNISDINKPILLTTIDELANSKTNSLCLSSDNKLLFSNQEINNNNNLIRVWNVTNVNEPILFNSFNEANIGSQAIQLVQNKLISGTFSSQTNIYDLNPAFELRNYFAESNTNPDGMDLYFFMIKILEYRLRQQILRDKLIQKNVDLTTVKPCLIKIQPLIISEPSLVKLFNKVPENLQKSFLEAGLVSFPSTSDTLMEDFAQPGNEPADDSQSSLCTIV